MNRLDLAVWKFHHSVLGIEGPLGHGVSVKGECLLLPPGPSGGSQVCPLPGQQLLQNCFHTWESPGAPPKCRRQAAGQGDPGWTLGLGHWWQAVCPILGVGQSHRPPPPVRPPFCWPCPLWALPQHSSTSATHSWSTSWTLTSLCLSHLWMLTCQRAHFHLWLGSLSLTVLLVSSSSLHHGTWSP